MTAVGKKDFTAWCCINKIRLSDKKRYSLGTSSVPNTSNAALSIFTLSNFSPKSAFLSHDLVALLKSRELQGILLKTLDLNIGSFY